jgi:hypothetical protein
MPCGMAPCQNVGHVLDLYGSADIDFALFFTLRGRSLVVRRGSHIEYRPLRAVVAPLADRKPHILVLWVCGTNRCMCANRGKLRVGTSGERHTT